MRVLLSFLAVFCLAACVSTQKAQEEEKVLQEVAAGQPFPQTCDSKNLCYKLGVLANEMDQPQKEIEYFKTGCQLGDDNSCVEVARIAALNGHLGLALQLLTRSCEREKNGFGCIHLAVLEDRLGNRKKASETSKRACDLGEGIGCQLVLNYLEDDATEQRFHYLKEARGRFTEACEGGEEASCEYLLQLTALEELERLNGSITYLENRCEKDGEPFCKQFNYLKFLTTTCERRESGDATECEILFEQSEKVFRRYFKKLDDQVFAH